MIHHMDAQAFEKDAGHIGKVEKTQGITSRLKKAIKGFSHSDLMGLHHAVSEELSRRAEQHSRSKSPGKMSDREFEKWAKGLLAKAEGESDGDSY